MKIIKKKLRDLNEKNIGKFMHEIYNSDWTLCSNDPNYSYECFLRQYVCIFNKCFSFETMCKE